jgi:hypothetical protein
MRRFAMRRIPWSPWGLSLVLLGNIKPEKTEGDLAGVREQMAGYLTELGL